MVNIYVVITSLLLHLLTAHGDGCLPLPINHFQWLNPDGSLIRPQALYHDKILNRGEGVLPTTNDCCGPFCSHKCRPVPGFPNCKLSSKNDTLVCQGSDVYNVPSPNTLPSTTLFLFKISGSGLISLPSKAFNGLSIKNLVIENTNLSHFAVDSFRGVKSIESLYLKNNKIDYILQADYLFQNISDLKFMSLEDSGLIVFSSCGTSNLHNLTYFSLAGNPLHTMDISFLQNSGLTFLDLRNITFKLKNYDIKDSGLSKLPKSLVTIDFSRATITNRDIEQLMNQLKGKNIKTLNLSYHQTHLRSFSAFKHMKNSLMYLSLQGTNLNHIFSPRRTKAHLSKHVQFVNMKELNLENCNISYFESGVLSSFFPYLTILSLARNPFHTLDLSFFLHLPNLIYLDLSGNTILDISSDREPVEVKNVQAVDLSNTKMDFFGDKSEIFFSTLKHLKMVSLCMSTLGYNTANALKNLNNLKYLDLSAVFLYPELGPIFNDLFSKNNMSLTELHFAQNKFNSQNYNPLNFSQLTSLEILDVSTNFIRDLSDDILLPTLKILNASENLITTWYISILNNKSLLQYLDVSNNQITYVTEAMIQDFYKLDFLSLGSNPLICHNKVVALVCSNIKNDTEEYSNETQSKRNDNEKMSYYSLPTKNNSHTLTLASWRQYRCYDVLSNGFRQFSQEEDCIEYYEEVSTTQNHQTTQYPDTTKAIQPNSRTSALKWEKTFLLVCSVVVVTALGGIVYVKWWNIRCFFHSYISLKKAHLLQKNSNFSSKPEVYYDIFVSYSDVDRPWILDHLVPNMERDGDVSLCFHERDFQVGMSILENIIDCMDHSHAMLLVVSNAFIYSKWCQFEMHLAQHRLIETFKDRLVLVLLEEVPRKTRPQTLRHLMMSKTYLMWPQKPCKDDAYDLFWRRLKRALRPNPN